VSFHDLAALLLPADADGAVCAAGGDWNVDREQLAAGTRSVWGREPNAATSVLSEKEIENF
jgi:hypothetical protein